MYNYEDFGEEPNVTTDTLKYYVKREQVMLDENIERRKKIAENAEKKQKRKHRELQQELVQAQTAKVKPEEYDNDHSEGGIKRPRRDHGTKVISNSYQPTALPMASSPEESTISHKVNI